MRILIKPIQQYGKLNIRGIHMKPENEADIEDAFIVAERDLFDMIVFYVNDLTLISIIRDYENECQYMYDYSDNEEYV